MRIVPRRIPIRFLGFVLLLAALAGLAGNANAQMERFKARSVRVPERTDAGTWDGTYWYANRNLLVAMWIRTTNGLPEIRLRVFNRIASEQFTTDWEGKATYEIPGGQGEFALLLTERDANTVKGTWTWDFQVGESVRKQLGEVTLFRAGIGREVVMRFDHYKFYIGPAGQERWRSVDQSWTFRKASTRLVRWEELPF